MALNFPNSPEINDVHTEAGQQWKWNGYAWDTVDEPITLFKTITADTGTVDATSATDELTITGGTDISTSITGRTLTIEYTGEGGGGGGIANAFATLVSDDGSFSVDSDQTLTVVGGTNISTEVITDSNQLTINLDSFPLSFLSNVSNTAATTGQVLKWDGSQWAPGTDVAEGGAGLDADTLDGFDSAYYLDYNNFTNTPSVLTLSDISIGNELTPAGNGAITYDNVTGIFRFTPPTAAGIGALTAEINDLTAAVTWANVPDANITESSVTQHQTALSITESQISDLGAYLTSISGLSIDALSDVDTTSATPSNDDVLQWNGSAWVPGTVSGGAGEVNQNAFSNVAVTGQTTVEADTKTDTLTLAAGSGISITTDSGTDTVTITSTVTSGASTFDGLSDVSSAGIDIDEIYEHAIVTLRVDNISTSAYTFNSHYSGNNPTIYALSGTTIAFDLSNIPGHPFEIQDPTLNPYSTGLVHVSSNGTVSTGTNAQGQSSGVLYWRVPFGISGNYVYQCQSHSLMYGTIVVKSFAAI